MNYNRLQLLRPIMDILRRFSNGARLATPARKPRMPPPTAFFKPEASPLAADAYEAASYADPARPSIVRALARRSAFELRTTMWSTGGRPRAPSAPAFSQGAPDVACRLRGQARHFDRPRLHSAPGQVQRCQSAPKIDPRSACNFGSDSLLMKLRRRFGLVSQGNQRHAVSSRLRVAPARLFRG